MSELMTSSTARFDPLDIQDLWLLITDLIDATKATCSSICALASSLAGDRDAGVAPLRQQLLEIRARLVYLLADVAYEIISHSSIFISAAAIVLSRNSCLGSAQGILASLEPQWSTIINACVTNRERVDECLLAWTPFHSDLCDLQLARSRQTGPVTSFLRALGAFGPEAPTPSTSVAPSSASTPSTVQQSLQSVGESITQIETFWRKRQELFLRPSDLDGARDVQNGRDHVQWAIPREISASLEPQFYSCIDSLRRPEPIIPKHPTSLSGATKTSLGWRALLVP